MYSLIEINYACAFVYSEHGGESIGTHKHSNNVCEQINSYNNEYNNY